MSRAFFVPSLSAGEAEDFRLRMMRRLESQASVTVGRRRVFSIHHDRSGKAQVDMVGQPSSVNPEPVLLILEAGSAYYGYTAHRGAIEGEPYMVASAISPSIAVTLFDDAKDPRPDLGQDLAALGWSIEPCPTCGHSQAARASGQSQNGLITWACPMCGVYERSPSET